MSPKYHISGLKNKLKEYMKKNRMINKKYFTPFSLIRIIEYFNQSRLSYGLCCFIDYNSEMKRLNLILMTNL